MSGPIFEISPGGRTVRAVDCATGRVLAECRASRTRIVQVLPLGEDVVVMEDHYRHPPEISNVYRLGRDLRELWRADLPAAGDAYTAVSMGDGLLRVSSWKCWNCDLDPATGRILQRVFTR